MPKPPEGTLRTPPEGDPKVTLSLTSLRPEAEGLETRRRYLNEKRYVISEMIPYRVLRLTRHVR